MMIIIRQILLSRYLGLVVRHVFTLVGGYLIAKGIATPEQAAQASDEAVSGINAFVSSPAFEEILGIILATIGAGAEVTKAKTVDDHNDKLMSSQKIMMKKY